MKSMRKFSFCVGLVALTAGLLASCSDDYAYDNKEPDWLGNNIYDYLAERGEYSTYLALADALDQKEVLKRTGSKTLFPATDEAYSAYLQPRGIYGTGKAAVDQMSPAMRRFLYNPTMLNMAYLDNMLSNVPAEDNKSGEGHALRHTTALTYVDSIPFVEAKKLPLTSFWDRFREDGRGVYLADNSARYSVFYTPQFFGRAGVTEEDWQILTMAHPLDYLTDDIVLNGALLTREKMNTTCKNGYLHRAEDVVLPMPNMAEFVERNGQTDTFAYLMNKFSAPYYVEDVNRAASSYYTSDDIKDSIFVRRYFNENDCLTDPSGKIDVVNNYGALYYDPADNGWTGVTNMGSMFVPTDAAMKEYISSKRGKFLRDQYGTWDNIPTDVLALFVKNHQRRSFLSSLPHSWDIMTDESSFYMKVKKEDVNTVETTGNGVVFVMNQVYPPIDYQCVYAPTLVADSTTVMKACIKDDNLLFYLYLRSMENQYNLLVPTNSALQEYHEPISWAIWANTGVDKRENWAWSLKNGVPVVNVYNVNEDGTTGAFRNLMDGSADGDALSRIRNRINDILDNHIIVADNEKEVLSGFLDSGTMQYGLTKGGTAIHVSGSGTQVKLAGGGTLEQGFPEAKVVNMANGDPGYYETDNGHTFFIDRVLDDPFKSVYTAMQEHPEYEAFFKLCVGESSVFSTLQNEDDIEPIFDPMQTSNSSGVGPVVTSFQNFRYTVLIPTAEALDKAFRSDPNLWTWERIDAEENYEVKKQKTQYLLNFIRYHFVDGLVPIAGTNIPNREYETAARDASNHFVRLLLTTHGSDLVVTTENQKQEARAITQDPSLYNIMTRDLIVNNKDYTKATGISASSRAVLHLVDHALNYQKK